MTVTSIISLMTRKIGVELTVESLREGGNDGKGITQISPIWRMRIVLSLRVSEDERRLDDD